MRKKSFRKGILADTIVLAGGLGLALLIGVVLFSETFGGIGKDTATLTREAGLKVRNMIATAGGIEELVRITDFSKDYALDVDTLTVRIRYTGILRCKTVDEKECDFSWRHFTEGVQPSSVTGADKICVVKTAAPDSKIFVLNSADARCKVR